MIFPRWWKKTAAALVLLTPLAAAALPHFDGAKALEYTREFVAIGPRAARPRSPQSDFS